jgi:UDPglucose 6-dehydrogenase
MKVTFFNTWYDICELFGANYNKVREGFLLDPRTGPMHTSVFKEKRGFGGHCFPKDLLAIINACESKGYNPRILKEIWETNKIMLGKNKKEDD